MFITLKTLSLLVTLLNKKSYYLIIQNFKKMEDKVFKEEYSFDDKVLFTLLGAGFVGASWGLLNLFLSEQAASTKTLAYIIIVLILGFLLFALRQLKLKVSINDKRIKYKMFPLHNKSQKIEWEEVESCEIVKSPYFAQWHGGNIQFNHESWYSLTGRNGLSIKTKDGRCLFIGCKNVEKLKQFFAKTFSSIES